MAGRIWLPLLLGAVCWLGGCVAKNPGDAAIAAKLAEIDAGINRLTIANESLQVASESEKHIGVNLAALAEIKPLPDNPTDAEVTAYAKAIFDASAEQNSFSSNDPQFAMIAKIGPGHFTVIVPYLDDHYFWDAARDLISPDDRAELFRLIPEHPRLLYWVPLVGIESGAELKRQILAAARRNQRPDADIPLRPYLEFLADDPEVWNELVELSDRNNSLWDVFVESIYDLPPAEREAKVRRRWELLKNDPIGSPYPWITCRETLARCGASEALESLLAPPPEIKPDWCWAELWHLLPDAANVPGDQLPEWYRQNRSRLKFIPDRYCYRLTPATPAKETIR
ncbi:MAG: hypothetical protein AB7F32_13580 [Victivallaceae bacterium]